MGERVPSLLPCGRLFTDLSTATTRLPPSPDAAGELTVASGRLVVGAPEVVAARGADVDTGDGSPVRARMHRGRQRLGLIVLAEAPVGEGTVTVGAGAAAVRFPTRESPQLLLAS